MAVFCVVLLELGKGYLISQLPFTRAATLGLLVLMTVLLWPRPLAAAPVPVRFVEGAMHGFLVLRTADGPLIASGDLLQVGRGGQVESRMVFRFKDGSVFDERAVFTQRRVFSLQSYRLVQHGPVFAEETEISLQQASGRYRVKTKARKDGKEKLLEGALDLPPDVYNGMILTVAKNLPKGAGETVHVVAFTPKPAESLLVLRKDAAKVQAELRLFARAADLDRHDSSYPFLFEQWIGQFQEEGFDPDRHL